MEKKVCKIKKEKKYSSSVRYPLIYQSSTIKNAETAANFDGHTRRVITNATSITITATIKPILSLTGFDITPARNESPLAISARVFNNSIPPFTSFLLRFEGAEHVTRIILT